MRNPRRCSALYVPRVDTDHVLIPSTATTVTSVKDNARTHRAFPGGAELPGPRTVE
jgi:hypothetical protein